jgi:di/tricarboxylate transporter
MNTDLLIVLGLLVAAIVMFVSDKPRMDVVALIMIVALPATGIITMNEALAGFADGNVVLIAALFVIGEGLVRTGVARRLGDWLYARAGSSETKLLVLLMLAVGGLGSVMSSTAVVAIFIPVVLRISQNTGVAPSKLMMPLSFAALISGMLTLVATTPNLVVNAELVRSGSAGFGFFAFTPFGLPLLVLGVIYMLFARRWLSAGDGSATDESGPPSLRQWVARYRLADRERRATITPASPLVGKTLAEIKMRALGVNLIAIERAGRFGIAVIRPNSATELLAGDTLLLDMLKPPEESEALRREYALEEISLPDSDYFTDRTQELGMAEALVPPESSLIGQSVLQARMRSVSGLTVVGLRRGRTVHGYGLLNETLKAGDTLLLVGFWSEISKLDRPGGDLIVLNLPAELHEVLPAPDKAPQALAVLALVVGLMISGLVPNVQAALFGCLLMGLLGCVDMKSAYGAISWKSLVLIVGMLPFSVALQRTGGVDLAADGLIALVGGATPRLVLGTLFAITALLGLFISNTATAVLMAPVALAIAHDLGASPYPFAMIVALAATSAFMTPISSPVNTLVVGPGNYGFFDFVRIGVPFTLIVLVVSTFLVPLLLPLH